MHVKKYTIFKRQVFFVLVLLGFLVIANQTARADTPYQAPPGWKQPNLYRVMVAQNETQTATNDKPAAPPESKEPAPKTDQKKDSGGVKKKPLKDFKPTERIEAEQAVDFPYDI